MWQVSSKEIREWRTGNYAANPAQAQALTEKLIQQKILLEKCEEVIGEFVSGHTVLLEQLSLSIRGTK
jgi:hypothetical protein